MPGFFDDTRIYKFLRMKKLGLSRARSFCINGGITVFETRFPRDSQKKEAMAVPRTRWRSDIRNCSPSSPVFASCGTSCSKKVSNTITAAVVSVVPSFYSLYSCSNFTLFSPTWYNRTVYDEREEPVIDAAEIEFSDLGSTRFSEIPGILLKRLGLEALFGEPREHRFF